MKYLVVIFFSFLMTDSFCQGPSSRETTNRTLNNGTILVYPNPANGEFDVVINSEYRGLVRIFLKNMHGHGFKKWKSRKSDKVLHLTFDVHTLFRGTYALTVIQGDLKPVVYRLRLR